MQTAWSGSRLDGDVGGNGADCAEEMCIDIYRSGICRVRVQSNHIICGHNGVRAARKKAMGFISAKRGDNITSSISLKVWQLLLQKLQTWKLLLAEL